MAEVIVMPQLGRITTEALLQTWFVDVGDAIALGDLICEIETDKATIEYESPFSGVLLARIEDALRVPVGQPIAVIGESGEDAASIPLYAEEASSTTSAVPTEQPETAGATSGDAPSSHGRLASPVARKRAEELGVDLETLTGSGPGGRVTRADVEKAASTTAVANETAPSRMWTAIVAAMTESASIPQFALERDIHVSVLQELLGGWRSTRTDAERPTVGDAITVALGRALAANTNFLRSWQDGAFVRRKDVDVGLAVALPDGLIVPVLRHADALNVFEACEQRRALQDKARIGRLSDADLGGAVATISNLGPFGVHRFHPLINPPESAIVGIGAPHGDPADPVLTLTVVADHRVVNGADAAKLIGDLADILETAESIDSLA